MGMVVRVEGLVGVRSRARCQSARICGERAQRAGAAAPPLRWSCHEHRQARNGQAPAQPWAQSRPVVVDLKMFGPRKSSGVAARSVRHKFALVVAAVELPLTADPTVLTL